MKLFTPIAINQLTLANRIVLPAMVTRLAGEDGFVNQDIEDRYRRYAEGEPGLIVVEAMAVHGARSGPLLRLSDDAFIAGHARLARLVHACGPVRILPQIIHFLKVARSGWRQKVKDLSLADIRLVASQYADAAWRARESGYDGVELHMAHAYTLSSFLSRRNLRPDAYGRTLENRLRLPLEVIHAVRERIGTAFALGVRFDAEECIKDGYTVLESRDIALRFARAGVDYLSLSAGGKFEDAVHKPGQPLYPYTGYSGDRCMPSRDYPDAANLPAVEALRRHLREHGLMTPVVATGKIPSPELAERILVEDRADLIGLARALLADPDWPRKAREGRSEEIVRCVYGNVCKNLDENFRKVTCSLWPRGELHAPRSSDLTPPAWPATGPGFRAESDGARIRLNWAAATDDAAVYGYEVWRAEDDGAFHHLGSARAQTTHFFDERTVAGPLYRYRVRAYDLAGKRSPWTETLSCRLGPQTHTPPEEHRHGL